MFNYEFFTLLGVTIVLHGGTFVMAVLIYRAQMKFFRDMQGKIEQAISDIGSKFDNPKTYDMLIDSVVKRVDEKIESVKESVSMSFKGTLGNTIKSLEEAGQGNSKAAGFLKVLKSKNKLKTAVDFVTDLVNEPPPTPVNLTKEQAERLAALQTEAEAILSGKLK